MIVRIRSVVPYGYSIVIADSFHPSEWGSKSLPGYPSGRCRIVTPHQLALIAYDRRVPDDRADSLRSILDRTYDAPDHPALIEQTQMWRTAKPFAGMRLLDASPVFDNTLAKYVPLLAGGADLTVCLSPLLPHDRETVSLLDQAGIPVVTGDSSTEYDVVLDCAGALAARLRAVPATSN